MSRVVVTGLGCLTACGANVGTTWEAVTTGRSGIEPVSDAEAPGWSQRLSGEIRDYQPRKLVADRKLLKVISRHDVIGLNAADQAIRHSKFLEYRDSLDDPTRFNDRTGVFVGSPGTKYRQQHDYLEPLAESDGNLVAFGGHAMDQVHPMWLLRALPNNVLAYIGIAHGFKGANENVTAHGISGSQAIAEAYRYLADGVIDRAVVAASDSASEREALVYYGSLGLLSRRGLRSFDRDRDGTVLGEAGGAIVLERLEQARERGATIHGEVLGSSVVSEGGLLAVDDDGNGVERAIRQCLDNAGRRPEEVGMITAHANGSRSSDASEARAISAIFGARALPVTGFKWAVAHTVVPSGIVEGILTLLSLKERRVPGIASLENLASDCEGISASASDQEPRSPLGLMITRGFAGLNSCILFSSDVD